MLLNFFYIQELEKKKSLERYIYNEIIYIVLFSSMKTIRVTYSIGNSVLGTPIGIQYFTQLSNQPCGHGSVHTIVQMQVKNCN